MEPGIEIKIVYTDDSLIQIVAKASNGRFAGEAEIYEDFGALKALANEVSGFPRNTVDVRTFELGSLDRESTYPAMRMHFRCVDSAGHTIVEMQVRADSAFDSPYGFASFAFPVEANAIDSFERELREMRKTEGARAHLRGGPVTL